jgi:branched-chain amino acid transport system ATP-binding protein
MICEVLKSIRSEIGTTIVFVEQNLDTILAIAERCYVMDKGRISTTLSQDQINADDVRAQLLI